MMSAEIAPWWFFLCAVAAVNVFAWTLSARALKRRKGILDDEIYSLRRLQLLLSAGYVLGCAYRSALPTFDVPRICLVDTWLSSAMVGRSVATFAELCFAAQWAILLREFSRITDSGIARTGASLIVPLIALAEFCSWYSVLTTSNLGHVVEESLWGVSASLLVAGLFSALPRCDVSLRPLIWACCVAALGYVVYMFLVDVPMYWTRWTEDEARGQAYLSIAQGFADASGRWTVSHRWDVWRTEVVWMSMYFSAAVWLSISLVHIPVLKAGSRIRGPARSLPIPRSVKSPIVH
jgi:hypothetical protein